MKILIKKGRIVDPAQEIDEVGDVLVENGKISRITGSIKGGADKTIDAEGKIVAPGFVDLHTHLREPGKEEAETIETGLRAAVKGGFTTVCAMPNTDPPCDGQAQARFLLERASEVKLANLLPIGTITKGRAGEQLSEMEELKSAGCTAVSDDGGSVDDAALMRKALEYASMLEMPVISHCEDNALAGEGVMHEGYWSTVLGLAPMPAAAESMMVERDIQLAQLTGAHVHIAHVSAAESLEIIRDAKKKGIKVTAEVTPHHFTLTDEDVKTYNTNYKVNPPLRSAEDIKAVKAAIKDGTIDAIATDHAPHLENEKEKEFDYAPFGMIGLETALSLAVTELIDGKHLDWPELIKKLTLNPCSIVKYDRGTLEEGKAADIVVIDPDKEWVYTKAEIKSKSKNSPFIGRKLKATVTDVIVGGKIVVKDSKVV